MSIWKKDVNFSEISNEIFPKTDKRVTGTFSSYKDLCSDIEVLPEYKSILDYIKNDKSSLFITGKAGTGKSTLINWLAKNCEGGAVIAPTAIAAMNVQGQTIHSFFGLPPAPIDPEHEYSLNSRSQIIIERIDYLIIDEVSMLLPNIVDAIDNILRRVRACTEPFGGIPILFVGDLYQLPPVVSSMEESLYFSHNYDSPFFFSAKVFKNINIVPFELVKVRRQSDEKFVKALNSIRINENHREHVARLNRNCYRDKRKQDNDLHLVTTNRQAKSINTATLNMLDDELFEYIAEVTGDLPLPKWQMNVPDILKIKVGARVIFLRNNQPDWINGDLGIVEGINERGIRVKKIASDNVVLVGKETWEKYKYIYDYRSQKIEKKVIGTFTQYPLSLGWAITIHKSQGMTLDSFTLDLGYGAFCEGQTYVALSRAKNIEGITLSNPIKMSDVKVSPVVKQFYQLLFGGPEKNY